jgi:hypothetical protein
MRNGAVHDGQELGVQAALDPRVTLGRDLAGLGPSPAAWTPKVQRVRRWLAGHGSADSHNG